MKRSHQVLVAVGVVVAVVAAPFAWRWLKRAIGAVVILGALVSPAAAAKKPKRKPGPQLQVFLLVTPIGFVRRGDKIQVRIRAYDPNHELSCPSWAVDCNDGMGHASSGLSDCEDGLPMPEDRPLVYRLPERGPVMCGPYWMPGDYPVSATISDGTHGAGQALSAIVVVGVIQVTGPPLPPQQVASR